MRLRTLAVLAAVVAALAGASAAAVVWGTADSGGSLSAVWVSDTERATEFNHHGVGANEGVVVAPVLAEASEAGLTRQSCSLVRLDAADGSAGWRRGVPPDRCFVHSLTKPAVVDVDGDGSQEVVANTIENETVVLAADGTEQFAIPTAEYGYGKPTVADLDGDGAPEIVTSDISGDLVVADGDGTVRWRGNVSAPVYDSPSVADVDGDESREVVVASRTETVVYERDGTRLWRRPVSGNDVAVAATAADAAATGAATAVDAAATGAETAAGTDEGVVVVAAGNDGVVALDGATGERLWNRSAAGTPAVEAVADADGDGTVEAYVSVAGNLVRAHDLTDGTMEWETRLAPADDVVTPPTVLADLSGDGDPLLVASTNGGTVVALDPATGEERAAYERDSRLWTGVTPADLTDSPGEELLVRYGDGRVVALEFES